MAQAQPGHEAGSAAGHVHPRVVEALERLLGGAGDGLREELASVADAVRLPAGASLFREGDPGDAAYVVVSGRLRVLMADAERPRALRDVGRGEIVGELALLTGAPRSATVVAARDTLLARIATRDLERVLERHPEAGLRLSRLLAERLRRATEREDTGPVARVVVAILAFGDRIPAAVYASPIAAALARIGAPSVIEAPGGAANPNGEGSAELEARLDAHEDASPLVLYVGEPGWTPWNAAITARADEVLLVADAEEHPAARAVDAGLAEVVRRGGTRVTLVLVHAPGTQPTGTAAWLDPRPGIAHLHVRADEPAEAARLARWVTGRSVALVLGGGGARGWAHIGAAQAIAELGVPVDLVGGTSIGALVGAAIADGMPADEMRRRSDGHVESALDFTLPLLSLMRGRRIARGLRRVAREGSTVEDLWRPFFAVATNLTRAEPMLIDRGPLVDAIRASVALPGILPPVVRDGDLVVDGGVLDNLPVAAMRGRLGRGRIVAVDVAPGVDLDRYDAFEPDISGWRLLWERLRDRGRRRRVPSIVDVIQRTVVAGSVHLRRRGRAGLGEDLVLEPQLGDWPLLAFAERDPIADAGYREMREPIERWWADRASEALAAEPGGVSRRP